MEIGELLFHDDISCLLWSAGLERAAGFESPQDCATRPNLECYIGWYNTWFLDDVAVLTTYQHGPLEANMSAYEVCS